MKKRVIRLNENDIERLVKKIMEESDFDWAKDIYHNKFIEGSRVSLDYDFGVVLSVFDDGDNALIKWQSDGEVEEWDANTFFSDNGGGKTI